MKSRANSSRTSMTCARTAPSASARSRTSASSRPWPRSSVTATTSAPYVSASQRDRDRGVEPARVRQDDSFHRAPRLIACRQSRRKPLAPSAAASAARAADHQDRVVAGDRADDLRRAGPRSIATASGCACPAIGPQHEQLLDRLLACGGSRRPRARSCLRGSAPARSRRARAAGTRRRPARLTSPSSRMSRESVACVASMPRAAKLLAQLLLAGNRLRDRRVRGWRTAGMPS